MIIHWLCPVCGARGKIQYRPLTGKQRITVPIRVLDTVLSPVEANQIANGFRIERLVTKAHPPCRNYGRNEPKPCVEWGKDAP